MSIYELANIIVHGEKLLLYRNSCYRITVISIVHCTRTGGHELDQRAIGVWKYVRTGINTYLKNQVENHSKIDNSINNQKSKISKSNFYKAQK